MDLCPNCTRFCESCQIRLRTEVVILDAEANAVCAGCARLAVELLELRA